MKTKLPIAEAALSRELAKQGYEMIQATSHKEGNIEVQANALHPVTVSKSDPVYVPVPVTLQVTIDKKKRIQHISGGTPTPEVAKDAEQFVKTLADNHQIEGLSPQQPVNPTHRIEVNDKGQSILKRRNFSLY